MVLREELEQREKDRLSVYACKSAESRGRAAEEEKDPMRTDFQRDRDRIIHSKSFRRMMHKTQVFLAPEGDHFRTRLTHTLEVSQIARTIARALDLNEDLTEAIAMGHDLGHTPFGHMGEALLDERHPGGFRHNKQSLRVVDVLELSTKGKHLNLTAEVRDGIVNHSGKGIPFTLEGRIVRLSDRIAYINHDIDDALRAGIITPEGMPADCIAYLGSSHGDRIETLVRDVTENSFGKSDILQSEEAAYYMDKLRDWMFEKVYKNPVVKSSEDIGRVRSLIFSLYDHYLQFPEKLPEENRRLMDTDGREEVVKDYIAGMTDRYAISLVSSLYVPDSWKL